MSFSFVEPLIALLILATLVAQAELRGTCLGSRKLRRVARTFVCLEFVCFLWWLTGADFTKRGWPLAASVLTLVLGAVVAYRHEENA